MGVSRLTGFHRLLSTTYSLVLIVIRVSGLGFRVQGLGNVMQRSKYLPKLWGPNLILQPPTQNRKGIWASEMRFTHPFFQDPRP